MHLQIKETALEGRNPDRWSVLIRDDDTHTLYALAFGGTKEEARERAAAIIANADLLAACEALLAVCNTEREYTMNEYHAARGLGKAAIAKARG